jgi:hypothetical protein
MLHCKACSGTPLMEIQLEEDITKQLSQMKMITQGTPGE